MKTITLIINALHLVWFVCHIYSATQTKPITYSVLLPIYLRWLNNVKRFILVTNSPWIRQHRHMCIQSAHRWQPCFRRFLPEAGNRTQWGVVKWRGALLANQSATALTSTGTAPKQRRWVLRIGYWSSLKSAHKRLLSAQSHVFDQLLCHSGTFACMCCFILSYGCRRMRRWGWSVWLALRMSPWV